MLFCTSLVLNGMNCPVANSFLFVAEGLNFKNHRHDQSVVPHLQPSNIEEKLQQGKNREVEIHFMTRVSLSWIQELTTDQTC